MTPEELQALLSKEINFDGTPYKGRGWTNKVKTFADLLRQIDSLDTAVGRKGTLIPNKNASEEEWQKFFQDIAADDKDYEEATKSFSEKSRAELAAAMKKFGLPAKAAKEIADAAKKAVEENYTKHYSKESFEELLKTENIEDVQSLAKIVDDVMGEGFLETHTEIPNEATLSMIKFAKGLTDKYGVKTPVEPKGKPAGANSGEPDAFEAALKAGMSGMPGIG